MTEPPLIPTALRVHLAHAVVQAVAVGAETDVLHVKGPAAASLRGERLSSDADVLVRPDQVNRFLDALRLHGWSQVTRLVSGGLLEHSTNWFHPQLGQLDVHVRFPGIRRAPSEAFELMWQEHLEAPIAHTACAVPNRSHHQLLLLIHAARNLQARDAEAEGIWAPLPAGDRDMVWDAARALGAEVALAAAVGGLDDFKDRPDYKFWAMASAQIDTPPGPIRFVAKLRAAPESAPRRIRGVIGHIRHVAIKSQAGAAKDPGHLPTHKARIKGLTDWVRHWLRPGPRRRT